MVLGLYDILISGGAVLDGTGAAACHCDVAIAEGNPHPRVYGTFTRIIQRFVVEKKALTLPKAVEKMTSAPARALRLRGKGLIAPGMDADLCVFFPENVREMGTYTQPRQLAQGMDTVLVAGQVAWERGQMTACRAGKVVKGDAG